MGESGEGAFWGYQRDIKTASDFGKVRPIPSQWDLSASTGEKRKNP